MNTEQNTENTKVKTVKPVVDKVAKLVKMQEHVENLNKKIESLVATKREVQAKAKELNKERFGNGGGSRGRGSKNFGKIKPAIEAHLAKVESALTVQAIATAIGMTYASVYQALKNAPEIFKCVNKHWILAKKVSETPVAEEVKPEVTTSVAA